MMIVAGDSEDEKYCAPLPAAGASGGDGRHAQIGAS